MQHEPISLLYLSNRKDPVVEDVIGNLNSTYNYFFTSDKDDFRSKMLSNDYSIAIVDHTNSSILYQFDQNHLKDHKAIILLSPDEPTVGSDSLMFDVVSTPINKPELFRILNNASAHLSMQQELQKLRHTLARQSNELQELNSIGVALSAERDRNQLLDLILKKSREITKADAGSLYLVETNTNAQPDDNNYFANKQLRFKLAHCDSIAVGYTEFVMPIEKKSIAGYVALSGQILNIPDAYTLPLNSEFTHNRSFDKSVGYRTKSMLVIPMKTHKDEIIGVLQLINRKKDWNIKLNSTNLIEEQVIPFTKKCTDLASSLASQAAISIENNRLYEEIKKLFEGFIRASVHAIEQRDPTTSGHSERVAILTTALAKEIDRCETGRFKAIKFDRDDIQTINYAALLHDFGKIGVRENVLVKAKKFYPHELEAVKSRFRLFKLSNELKGCREKILLLLNTEKYQAFTQIEEVDTKIRDFTKELDYYLNEIIEANEPRVLKEEGYKLLAHIEKVKLQDNGFSDTLLTTEEIKKLSIPKGSLSDEEREEIESHVTHTFNFLSRIPWTTELKNVPYVAYAHHEKLDGSGYPRQLNQQNIPIQSQMMTIADIYDALTAWDRPYKKAVPLEKALDILNWEVKDGKIDADLYHIFVEAKLYDLVKKPE
jgi:HD-GYP domain-containing protein (c-di-GMP phosphodiesterase class II)